MATAETMALDLGLPAAGSLLLATALSWAGTGLLLGLLRRRAILDHPNERSSHSRPTPRGGGLAVMAVTLAMAAAYGVFLEAAPGLWPLLGGALLLAVVSWIDDLRGLGPGLRILVQAAAVLAAPTALPVFQGLLPGWLDLALSSLIWLWFINLFNFMDGIDGIAGTQTLGIAAGLVLLSLVAPALGLAVPALALVLGGAMLGFLVWNWHPAKIFLGDVGSVPAGYLLGWLLLATAAGGAWAAALILPLYYLADGTITLLRRLARGERPWHAHREHFYQRAVQAGRSHAEVARLVGLANLGLVALALASETVLHPAAALGGAVLLVGLLLAVLARPPRRV